MKFVAINRDEKGNLRAEMEAQPRTAVINVEERRITQASSETVTLYLSPAELEERRAQAYASDTRRSMDARPALDEATRYMDIALNGMDVGAAQKTEARPAPRPALNIPDVPKS